MSDLHGRPGTPDEDPRGMDGGEETPQHGGEFEPDGFDEDALRSLFHGSVADLEPSPDALERLHHAVPVRRARRRQALVGAGALAVVAAVGIPVFLFGGVLPDDDRDSVTAHETQGQTQGPADGAGESSRGTEGSENTGESAGGRHNEGQGPSGERQDTEGADRGADPSDTLVGSAPSCGREQLGAGSGDSGEPDEQGRVYGSFRVTNTSGEACSIQGEGVVGAAMQGTSTRKPVRIVDHTPGDPAAGLPDPASEADELVLEPGAAYLVKFAWVPDSATCRDSSAPPGGEGPGAVAGDGTGEEGDDDGDEGKDDGGETGGSGGPEEDPLVVISHTPDGGTPQAADTAVKSSCPGTIYRTGVLPAG
ncbi:hypothetical protein [Streptomyces sulphureus]|uniref:hypothetical protein n=1 Tax=Streptomyces sulphureus TaxID=47758 RepID=UPI0003A6965A|nr:hypothetical protein [Streptomyces sulphureus]